MRQIFTLTLLLLAFSITALGQADKLLYPRVDQQEPRRYGDGILNLLAQGEREMQRNQFVDAIRTYSSAVAQAPNLAEAYILRAKAYRLIGETTQAQEDYRKAMQLDPVVVDVFAYGSPTRRAKIMAMTVDSALLLSSHATIMASYQRYVNQMAIPLASNLAAPSAFGTSDEEVPWNVNRLDEALQLLWQNDQLKAMDLLVDWPTGDDDAALAFSLAGYIELLGGRGEYAESWWFDAAEADPTIPFPYYHLSRQALMNNYAETAIGLLEETLELDQAFLPARQDLLAIGGRYSETLQADAWTEELSVYQSPMAYLNRSLARYEAGDYANALADAGQAIQLAEQPAADLYAWRGNMYLLVDQPDMAERDLTTALTRGADPAPVLQNRGLARILSKNRGAGCADLKASSDLGNLAADELWVSLCRF